MALRLLTLPVQWTSRRQYRHESPSRSSTGPLRLGSEESRLRWRSHSTSSLLLTWKRSGSCTSLTPGRPPTSTRSSSPARSQTASSLSARPAPAYS